MEDIEWIQDLRKKGFSIEDISLLVGISKVTVRKILHNQLPGEIVLKEFHLCPYDNVNCKTFRDNLCSCGITTSQFMEKNGARKHPCPFFKDRDEWNMQEVRRLSEDDLTYAQISEETGLSVNIVRDVYKRLDLGKKRRPKKFKGV